MSVKAVLVAAALIVAGGGAAATGGAADIGAADAQPQERPSDVDTTATLTNGTVTLVVTDAGNASEGVNVSVDDERVGATDANGTVTFAAGNDSELELALTAPGFEGELEYVVRNDTLVLESEEYEYAVSGADEDGDADEEDGETNEEAADAPGHDGDLPEEAAEEARENSQRRGPPADVPAGADDTEDEDEDDEDEEEAEADDEEDEEDGENDE